MVSKLDEHAYRKIVKYCDGGYIAEADRMARTIISPTIRDCAVTKINETVMLKWASESRL